jgi:hypothetical protein
MAKENVTTKANIHMNIKWTPPAPNKDAVVFELQITLRALDSVAERTHVTYETRREFHLDDWSLSTLVLSGQWRNDPRVGAGLIKSVYCSDSNAISTADWKMLLNRRGIEKIYIRGEFDVVSFISALRSITAPVAIWTAVSSAQVKADLIAARLGEHITFLV